MRPRLRTPAALLIAALGAVMLSACTMSTGGASDSASFEVDRGGFASTESSEAPDRSVVVTGSITLTADDPIVAAEEATRIVVAAGGRVDAREQSAGTGDDDGSAYILMRIPVAELDAVRDKLGDLGRIESTSTSSADVGVQQRDLETRTSTLRTSIARYSGWLDGATTTKDLIELESAISARQTELEILEAEQRALADQVALSTIGLYVYTEATTPASTGPTDFGSALGVGWNAFGAFWVGVTVVVGVLLPWLVLAAIGTGIAVGVTRGVKSRRPSGAPESSA